MKRILARKLFQISVSMRHPITKDTKREKVTPREMLKFKLYRVKVSDAKKLRLNAMS